MKYCILQTLLIASLSASNALAGAPITGSRNECSNTSLTDIQEKIVMFNKYEYIDNPDPEKEKEADSYSFDMANIVLSNSAVNPSNGKTHVSLAIQPLPLMDGVMPLEAFGYTLEYQYPLNPKTDYPKLIIACEVNNADTKSEISCERLKNKPKYAVDEFSLSMKAYIDTECANDIRIESKYSIVINDGENGEYTAIINKFKESLTLRALGMEHVFFEDNIDSLSKPEVFFKNYFDAFLLAWETTDWHERETSAKN